MIPFNIYLAMATALLESQFVAFVKSQLITVLQTNVGQYLVNKSIKHNNFRRNQIRFKWPESQKAFPPMVIN